MIRPTSGATWEITTWPSPRPLGLTRTDMVRLARNSIEASFLSEDRKAGLQDEITAYVRSYPASP